MYRCKRSLEKNTGAQQGIDPDTLFWTSSDTSVVTPVDLLAVSMVAEPFLIHVIAHIQALMGLESGIEHATRLQWSMLGCGVRLNISSCN